MRKGVDSYLDLVLPFGKAANKDAWFHAFEYTTFRIISIENALGSLSQGIIPGLYSVGQNADGRLEVFAINDQLWHIWQLSSGGWSSWSPLGAPKSTKPVTPLHQANGEPVARMGAATG